MSSPRLARVFLEHCLPAEIREPVLGDFEESFGNVAARRGSGHAVMWYWSQAFHSVFACLSGKIGEQFSILYARLESESQTLARHRRYSLTSTIGLSIAFTCCILIALFVAHELSFDRHQKNADRIFRITTPDGVALPGLLGPELRSSVPHVEQSARLSVIVAGGQSRIVCDDKFSYSDRQLYTESEAFDIFDWKLVDRCDYRLLDNPFSVVLSQPMAAAIFGGKDPLGKTVNIDSHDFTVTGVIKDIPLNSSLRPNIILSFSSLDSMLQYNNYTDEWITSWAKGHSVTPTWVLLDDPKHASEVAGAVSRIVDKHRIAEGYGEEAGDKIRLQPLKDIYLGSEGEWQTNTNGDPKQLIGMGIAVLLILLVAGINIINLVVSIWQSDARSQDFCADDRKRFTRFVRFSTESFVITILALTFALFASRLLLPLFGNVMGCELLFHPRTILWIALSSIPFSLITGAIASLNPEAFLKPAGEKSHGKPAAYREYYRTRHGRLLVAFQFVVAGVLVFSSALMIAQTRFLKSMPMGYDKDDLLVVHFQRGSMTSDQFRALKSSLLDLSVVESACASYAVPEGCPGETIVHIPGSTGPHTITSQLFIADSDFLDTYRIPRLTPAREDIRAPGDWMFWFNRRAIEELGWSNPDSAIGKNLVSNGACYKDWQLVVSGVFENYHQCPVEHGITPLILCIPPEDTYWNLSLRLKNSTEEGSVAAVVNEWKRLQPDVDFDRYFLAGRIAEMSEEEHRVARQILFLAIILLAIACTGLNGLVSYTIAQRAAEIDSWLDRQRNRGRLIARLSGSFVLMIVITMTIAWPISLLVTRRWLDKFSAQVDLGPDLALLVGGGVILFSLSVILIPAMASVFSRKRVSTTRSGMAYERF